MQKLMIGVISALMTVFLPAQAADDTTGDHAAVTIYNQGPAVVSQTRDYSLDAGTQMLTWPGTPPGLLADSLWLTGDGVTLTAATVRPQATDPAALLAERIGQPVKLLSTAGQDSLEGRLVSVSGTTAVVQVDDRMLLVAADGNWQLAWPATDDDAGALQLRVKAEHAGSRTLTLRYQRPGLNWHASYAGQYDADENTLTLQPQAVIDNDGQVDVQADQVALIAGAVARTSGHAPVVRMMASKHAAADGVSAPEATGGYYRYTVDGHLSLAPGATQGLPLMSARTFDVEREYHIDGNWYRAGSTQRNHARIVLRFDNTADQPLPAGPVRVYDRDDAMLLGEDTIGNVPKDAPVKLTLGRAFDITAERQVTASSTQDKQHRQTVTITLHNAGRDDARVHVGENLPSGADILSESTAHESKTASRAEWLVTVPADGQATLTYRIGWTT